MNLQLNTGGGLAPKSNENSPAESAKKPETQDSAQSKGALPSSGSSDEVIYSCHPLDKFSIGTKWKFVNSQLKLSPDEAKKLDEYLKKADVRTRNLVKKIDVKAAEAMIAARAPVATKSLDSAVHHEDHTAVKGTEDLNRRLAEQQAQDNQ